MPAVIEAARVRKLADEDGCSAPCCEGTYGAIVEDAEDAPKREGGVLVCADCLVLRSMVDGRVVGVAPCPSHVEGR